MGNPNQATVDAILLAAGSSSRLGASKQELLIQGTPLLTRTAETLRASQLRNIIVVTGEKHEDHKALVDHLEVLVIQNQRWEQGMGNSIKCGMHEILKQSPDAVLISVCDQPFLNTPLVNQFIELFRAQHPRVIASAYNNTLGVPALFEQSLFNEIADLDDQHGAKHLITLHNPVLPVNFPLGGVDIDTEDDFLKIRDLLNG